MSFYNDRGQQVRPSKYLLDKVVNFSNTLQFFLSNENGTKHSLNEKRIVFLAQIDFWEWEMETLIYSFSNFRDRAKAWAGCPVEMLRKNGILTKTKAIENLRWDRRWHGTETVAPIAELNECIDKWNRLLETCEQTVMVNASEIETFNAGFIKNLDKYRKQSSE